jgi:hypothetical protein
MEDPMKRFCNIAFFVGGFLVMGISTSAIAQSKDANTATTHLAYSQVFTDPQDATCPNPRHRKIKTSKGYKWRWVC